MERAREILSLLARHCLDLPLLLSLSLSLCVRGDKSRGAFKKSELLLLHAHTHTRRARQRVVKGKEEPTNNASAVHRRRTAMIFATVRLLLAFACLDIVSGVVEGKFYRRRSVGASLGLSAPTRTKNRK